MIGTCDWGGCMLLAEAWRWSEAHGWLPVCMEHYAVEEVKTYPSDDLAKVEVPRGSRPGPRRRGCRSPAPSAV